MTRADLSPPFVSAQVFSPPLRPIDIEGNPDKGVHSPLPRGSLKLRRVRRGIFRARAAALGRAKVATRPPTPDLNRPGEPCGRATSASRKRDDLGSTSSACAAAAVVRPQRLVPFRRGPLPTSCWQRREAVLRTLLLQPKGCRCRRWRCHPAWLRECSGGRVRAWLHTPCVWFLNLASHRFRGAPIRRGRPQQGVRWPAFSCTCMRTLNVAGYRPRRLLGARSAWSARAKRAGAKRARAPSSTARRGVRSQGWQTPAQRRGTGKKRLGFVARHSLESPAYVI